MAAGVTNQGLNHILATEYCSGSQVTSWFLGLINNTPGPSFSASDTLGSHAGWAETTSYSGGNRLAWGNGSASGQQTTNASTVNFAITASVTIYGLFLASVNTGTSGILSATAAFSGGVQAVNNGDTLQVTLIVSAASG